MLEEYLEEILSGNKSYDARAYDTNKRGTIALIDSRKSEAKGLINLVSTHPISAKEYADWHKIGKWTNATFEADPSGKYYAYEFECPIRLARPVKITKTSHTWCETDDKEIEEAGIQNKLF